MLITIAKIYLLNEEVVQIHNRVENGDDSWLQDNENGEEASQIFEFIEIPSYVSLISDNSSEPVYFVKVEAKGNREKIMPVLMVARYIQERNIFGVKDLQKVPSRKSNKKQFQLINRDTVT